MTNSYVQSIFYTSKVKLYTDNVCASVTNSMSGAVEGSVVNLSAVQSCAVWCNAMQCSAMHGSLEHN